MLNTLWKLLNPLLLYKVIPMQKKRLLWADALKGVLILLVVLGHSIQNTIGDDCYTNHMWNFIYSFHMPAFMAVSGYLSFRVKDKVGGAKLYSTIWRRFKQLVIPFVLWTVFLLLYNNSFTIESIVEYILYPDKGLWFLWVLFIINVIFVISDLLSEKTKIKQEIVMLSICVVLAITMVMFELRVFSFQFIAYYFMFYVVGYYLHKYYDRLKTDNRFLVLLLLVVWGGLAWFWQMKDVPSFLQVLPLPSSLTLYAYRFVTALLATYVLIIVSPKVLNDNKRLNLLLGKFGVVSLGIYTSHVIFIRSVVALFVNVNRSNELVIFMTFFSSSLISYVLVWMLSKWRVTSCLLLGKN